MPQAHSFVHWWWEQVLEKRKGKKSYLGILQKEKIGENKKKTIHIISITLSTPFKWICVYPSTHIIKERLIYKNIS